jgi:dipeptidyl aminopeptidase/acylaminoacyl peptidase
VSVFGRLVSGRSGARSAGAVPFAGNDSLPRGHHPAAPSLRVERLVPSPVHTLLAAACIALAGCATPPTHPALADLHETPLVPVRTFIADVDYSGGNRISPDGTRLVWMQVSGTRVGLAAREVDGNDATVTRFETGTIASWSSVGIAYNWLSDSRHVMYVKDPLGDENTQIHVFRWDDSDGALHNLTPWPGARSIYLAQGTPGTARFFFQSNRRDRSAFDVYEADAEKRTVREVIRSDGDVTHWLTDIDGSLGGRIRVDGKEANRDRLLEILDPATGEWRVAKRFGPFGYVSPLRLDRKSGKLVANSGLGRNTTALVSIDLATGTETELFRDQRVDLTASYVPLGSTVPYAVQVDPGYPEIRFFDEQLGRAVVGASSGRVQEPIVAVGAGTADRSMKRIIVRPMTVRGEREFLFDRESSHLTLLKDVRGSEAEARAMVPVEPIMFESRDGLAVHGYLLRPRVPEGRRVPMVVAIHGGPWQRDFWEPSEPNNGFAGSQLLANRGYAVLHVNYRGSTGYGGKFMYAAVKELGGRTQDDIEDGAQWAIARGIADPARIGLLGDSFGGFSVLSQMVRSPERYACGVNIVGIADWQRWLDEKPPYWHNLMHWWNLFLGVSAEPASPADRDRLRDASPLTRIDRIRSPLLVIHGANDVRVAKQDSDEVVAKLQGLGRPVEYLVFADEGHAIRKWQNRLRMWRAIEDFYAGCLGGRSAGFDLYQLIP